jgi:phytoene synthase
LSPPDPLNPITASAREIVRRSGSNLAFALAVLPRAKRRDMEVFYAFCRVVDDLVDEPDFTPEERRAGLDRWRGLVEGTVSGPREGIERQFADLVTRRDLNRSDLLAILDGMEMDLAPRPFSTTADLRRYCYHVASAVGLVSVDLFGCEDPGARAYAEELGYALQWTNLLRDVGEDAKNGRVFLPLEDLHHFGLDETAILSGSPDPEKFRRVMSRGVAVARAHFRESLAALAALPRSDQECLGSAELMRRLYTRILDAMERDGFRVYETRYRPGKLASIGGFFRAKFLA